MNRSIAELRVAGITFDADEAVAIAQQLITALRNHTDADEVHPPYGPPTIENVFLREDGSVFCTGCKATPGVSEVGIFLDSLLPEGSPRVPGGVRYAIARALLNVDVPPFDSLEELSMSLARHERRDRAEVVRTILSRSGAPRRATAMALVDRRRPVRSSTELRRALREADVRLFEQQRQLPREPIIDLLPPSEPAPRERTMTAAAMCVAAGLALIGTGEFMHKRQAPVVGVEQAPAAVTEHAPLVVTQVPLSDEPRTEPQAAATSPEPGIIVVHPTPSAGAEEPRLEPRKISVKRPARPAAGVRKPVSSRAADPAKGRRFERTQGRSQRGVLDKLRLGWLRAFATRSAL